MAGSVMLTRANNYSIVRAVLVSMLYTGRRVSQMGSQRIDRPQLVSYCVGSQICVKPMVLMARSIGVNGGSKFGVRKFVSNTYARVGGP
jgi:hypothetical protein